MLSDSQIKQAKSLAFEYTVCTKEIRFIQDELNKQDIKPEVKELRQKELTDLKQRQKDIEEFFKKEFSVDLQELQDRTPLGIMNHIRKQQERELVPVYQQDTAGDRPLEKQINAPIKPYMVNTEKVARDQKELSEQPKQPEPEQKPYTTQTLTVTHQREVPESEYEDLYKRPVHHDRPNRRRGRDNT